MPDLESLKRSVDFAQYARSMGYQERPSDSAAGITVLEHERLRDRIAVARLAGGGIYARIPDYTPRGPDESDERARQRLRDCITRSSDAGSIVEFVRSNHRRAGRPEPDLERVREHLTAWQSIARELPRGAQQPASRNVLNRRIGDWVPSPVRAALGQDEVQERLRRWQEAQRAIDLKLARAREPVTPQQGQIIAQCPTAGGVEKARSPNEVSRAPNVALAPNPEKIALGQRRYDWTPPVGGDGAKTLGATPRSRGPERGR